MTSMTAEDCESYHFVAPDGSAAVLSGWFTADQLRQIAEEMENLRAGSG